MKKGELKNCQKKKKETFWVNGHFNSSRIRHENKWKKKFVSVYFYVTCYIN